MLQAASTHHAAPFQPAPTASAGTVYSYVRFSSMAQGDGTSIARQSKYAADYARERNLKLDTMLKMTDKGLSAFTGKHLSEGALGIFVAAIESGIVQRGSILVVESLDRLSRAKPMEAQELFSRILRGGVMIVTQSDRQEYTWETVNSDMGKMMMLTIVACRAHEESKTKSKRKTDTLTIQCEAWVAGRRDSRPMCGGEPSWVKVTRDGATLVDARVEAIRMAVRLYLRGYAPGAIAKELTQAGVAMTADGTSVPHIEKTLRSRALIGEKTITVRRRMDDDTFAKHAYVLEDFFPKVLTLAEWHELEDARNGRGRRRSKGLVTHVLTGTRVTRCGHCGSVMMGNTQHLYQKDGSIRPRAVTLRCMGRRRINPLMDCPGYGATPAFMVERAIVRHCRDLISLQALYGDDRTAAPRALVATTRERCEKIAAELGALARLAVQAEVAGKPSETYAQMISELEAQQRSAKKTLAEAEREFHASQHADLTEVAKRWADVAHGVETHDSDARLLARQLFADTFSSIAVFVGGANPNETLPKGMVDILLLAKGGVARGMRINRRGEWTLIEDIRDWRATPKQPGLVAAGRAQADAHVSAGL